MGTTSSRGDAQGSTHSQKREKFSKHTVELLISEQKLAPRNIVHEPNAALEGASTGASPSDDTECPICFLNYAALNQVNCCKQVICTNCYVELRNAKPVANDCPCPFCHQLGFLTKYVHKPGFDYSNDTRHADKDESDKRRKEHEMMARRRSGSGNFNPSAFAEKATERVNSVFDSIRLATSSGSNKGSGSGKTEAASHHFTQSESQYRSSSLQEQGKDGSAGSSTPSSVQSASGNGNTPQKIGPLVIPKASRADRASLEAQIRSQHREFDEMRDTRPTSGRGGGSRIIRDRRSEGGSTNSDGGRQHLRRAAGNTGSGSGGSGGSGDVTPLEEISRLLSSLGTIGPGGQRHIASMSDVERMEDLMLEAALRESEKMEAEAQKKREVEAGKIEMEEKEAAAKEAAIRANALQDEQAALPPPVPSAKEEEGESVDKISSNISSDGGRESSRGDDQEDVELQLALALSLQETQSPP